MAMVVLGAEVRVLRGKLMAVDAMRFPGILRGPVVTAHGILTGGAGFHVRRIHAMADAAQMIQGQAFWDWPNHLLVHPAVSTEGLPVDSQAGVAGHLVNVSGPQPARRAIAAIFFSVGITATVVAVDE